MSSYELRKTLGQRLQRLRLKRSDFTLISNDCWGAEVYKYVGVGYNTPFIGLYLMADDYLQLLSKPQHYLSGQLEFISHSRHETVNRNRQNKAHPIGLLRGEIEVQFLHYESELEARQKWERRLKRVNWNNLLVKFDGSKDGAGAAEIQAIAKLPYPTLTLLREPVAGAGVNALVVQRYSPDGLVQFNASLADFDLIHWLNTGQVQQGVLQKLISRLLVLEN